MWRELIIRAIRNDAKWKGGDYTSEPRASLQMAGAIQLIAGSAPIQMQKNAPTRDAADDYVAEYMKRYASTFDANDTLYLAASAETYGHATHTHAAAWQAYLQQRLLRSTKPN